MSNISIKNAINNNISNFIQNAKVAFYNFKVRRDPYIWLFGAWMGNRFADNSRFLFQHLSVHKDDYGIKEVIWATRSEDVYNEVQSLGYKAVIIGSEESDYYHLISGVHIICNSSYSDIDTRLSAGAKKIQLWHGVGGCKAVGRLNRERMSFVQKLADIFIWPFYEPGNWNNAYFLASSPENARVVKGEHGCNNNRIFEAITPRLCPCEKYKTNEIEIINQVKEFQSEGFKIVLYLPTFRDNNNTIISPLEIDGVLDYLNNYNVIWISKSHFADSKSMNNNNKNIISLDSDFDINVLYDFIDLLVTDYSSASSDAIFKHVRTLEYCPDMEDYKNNNRKFTADFSLYHAEPTVLDSSDFLNALKNRLMESTDSIEDDYKRVRTTLFSDNSASYSEFMNKLLKKIKL